MANSLSLFLFLPHDPLPTPKIKGKRSVKQKWKQSIALVVSLLLGCPRVLVAPLYCSERCLHGPRPNRGEFSGAEHTEMAPWMLRPDRHFVSEEKGTTSSSWPLWPPSTWDTFRFCSYSLAKDSVWPQVHWGKMQSSVCLREGNRKCLWAPQWRLPVGKLKRNRRTHPHYFSNVHSWLPRWSRKVKMTQWFCYKDLPSSPPALKRWSHVVSEI